MGISDEEWMTIGSYNINNISTYASIEVNVDIKNNRFIKEVIFKINDIIDNHCIKITRDIHLRNKNLFKQFGRWVSYQTIQFLFFMCTFYFKRKH
jgi:cardiolipin synthase